MARIHDVTFDSRHPASSARFWAAALDDYEVAPYDLAELDRLRMNGSTDPDDDPTVVVEAHSGPRLLFELVHEPKTVKNRVHLDLRCESFDADEVARLTALGASVLEQHDSHFVLLDPEGNEFCLSRRTAS
jgi:Glyoxalase-like domain